MLMSSGSPRNEPMKLWKRARKACVRAFCGRTMTSPGGPISTITPSLMKATGLRDLVGEGHLVRDQHHRHALLGQRADHVQHLADELRVERRGHLVEQDHVRVHGKRPRDRDALLLAAREVRRDRRAALSARPTLASSAIACPWPPAGGIVLHEQRAGADVLERGHVREQVEVLEHHAGARRGTRRARGRRAGWPAVQSIDLIADAHAPALGHLEQVDAAQERRFAGAGRPDQRQARSRCGTSSEMPFRTCERPKAFHRSADLDHGSAAVAAVGSSAQSDLCSRRSTTWAPSVSGKQDGKIDEATVV